MFWTDWGSTPKIERATLAGTNRTLLINLTSSVQNWPNAIILDYLEDRIYWIDAWVDAIDSADLDGNNRRAISSQVHPSRDMHPLTSLSIMMSCIGATGILTLLRDSTGQLRLTLEGLVF